MIPDPSGGKVRGVYIDALNSVFSSIKIKPVWIEQTFANFAAALQSDQIDVFVGASFATPQRALALSFTRPFAYMGNGVMVKQADAAGRFKDVKSLMDLDKDGLTIVAPLGSSGHDWLKAHFTHARIVALDAPNRSQGPVEVLAGRAEAFYTDSFVIAGHVRANPGQLVDLFETRPLDVSPIAWAIKRKQPDLLDFLNTTLEYMDTNGAWLEFEQPYKKDLGGYYHADRNYFSVAGQTHIGQ
jgi:polar amino acid transport system substrate-binding protein